MNIDQVRVLVVLFVFWTVALSEKMLTLIHQLVGMACEVCLRVYFLSEGRLKRDQMNHYNCCATPLGTSGQNKASFRAAPYLCYSHRYLTNGPRTDTQSSYTSAATKVDKHAQCTHITHVNSTGLDLFPFAVKDTTH